MTEPLTFFVAFIAGILLAASPFAVALIVVNADALADWLRSIVRRPKHRASPRLMAARTVEILVRIGAFPR